MASASTSDLVPESPYGGDYPCAADTCSSERESDIVDQYHPEDSTLQEDTPVRPPSRLGFCHKNSQDLIAPDAQDDFPPHSPSRSSTMDWTRNLFHRIGIATLSSDSNDTTAFNDDMDITTVITIDSDDAEPTMPPREFGSSSSLDSLGTISHDDDNLSSSDEDDDLGDSESDCSSCEDSDIDIDVREFEHERPAGLILTCPTPSSSSVPFPISCPIPIKELPPLPDAKPKFSCLPSPLSPRRQALPSSFPPQRHNYDHRGYSRHALLHVKWFWAVREEEWTEYTTALHESNAYGGISAEPMTTINPLRLSEFPPVPESEIPRRPAPPSAAVRALPPMTIHPRWGDVSALRDPYCAHMDRYFVGMPLWTMAKALWMFDVHISAERRARDDQASLAAMSQDSTSTSEKGDSDEESLSEELMGMSVLTGFSDDSDVTLVESESDNEVGRMEDSHAVLGAAGRQEEQDGMEKSIIDEDEDDFTFFEDVDLDAEPSGSASSYKLPESDPFCDSSEKAARVPRSASRTSHAPNSYGERHLWEVSWYRRFELLIQLAKFNKERECTRPSVGDACATFSDDGEPMSVDVDPLSVPVGITAF